MAYITNSPPWLSVRDGGEKEPKTSDLPSSFSYTLKIIINLGWWVQSYFLHYGVFSKSLGMICIKEQEQRVELDLQFHADTLHFTRAKKTSYEIMICTTQN